MKMYLISDNIDTQIGMRLVGIDGCVAHDSETITAEIKKAVNDPELGILIFTEKGVARSPDLPKAERKLFTVLWAILLSLL